MNSSPDAIEYINEPAAPIPRKSVSLFALCGLGIAVIGLALAVFKPYLASAFVSEPPPAAVRQEEPQNVKETIVIEGMKFAIRFIEGKNRDDADTPAKATAGEVVNPLAPPHPAEPLTWLWYVTLGSTALGFVGAMSGTVGWIRREDHRFALAAMVVGGIAVAWVYIVAALMIALVIGIFLIIFGGLGS